MSNRRRIVSVPTMGCLVHHQHQIDELVAQPVQAAPRTFEPSTTFLMAGQENTHYRHMTVSAVSACVALVDGNVTSVQDFGRSNLSIAGTIASIRVLPVPARPDERGDDAILKLVWLWCHCRALPSVRSRVSSPAAHRLRR